MQHGHMNVKFDRDVCVPLNIQKYRDTNTCNLFPNFKGSNVYFIQRMSFSMKLHSCNLTATALSLVTTFLKVAIVGRNM
jgi:hypothetical protein